MEALFLQILSMSISASWLIVTVIAIRFLLKKAPKGFRYVLWALVAVRLFCPTFIESDFSMIPNQDMISDVGEAVKPVVPGVSDEEQVVPGDDGHNGNVQDDEVENQEPQENQGPINNIESIILPDNETQDNTSQNTVTVEKMNSSTFVTWVWMGGILALFGYAVVSYGLLRNTIKASIHKEDNLWVCDGIQSPFILGLIHPQIYLPSYIEKNHIPYIVAHEKEHIRCRDNWWKVLGFTLLSIHWFNPFVWLAYILMCKDIEMACDERVIRSMGAEDKKNYSKSLLLCSSPKHFISACPVAFGEVGVKERIKKIVDYRKPSVWIIGIGIVLCLFMVIGFMTNPKAGSKEIAKIRIASGPEDAVITDAETMKKIVDGVNDLVMVPVFPSLPSGGWSYSIHTYDSNGNIIDHITILGDDTVKGEYFVYKAINGAFDTEYYDELIAAYQFEQWEKEQEALEGKTQLKKDTIEWFSSHFFNNEENRITNAFLTSTYRDARNIDLRNLFYHGSDGYGGGTVSEEEKQLLAQIDDWSKEVFHLDTSKATKQEMDTILQRYLGMSLDETNKVNLRMLYYLKEYDAYYHIASDCVLTKITIVDGWKEDETGNIILQYFDALSGNRNDLYNVTLRLVDGNYRFVSNISLSEDEMVEDDKGEETTVDLISKEKLEWFATEFFNNEENPITNQFLLDVYTVPEDVNLYELFYNGAGVTILGGADIPSEEEKDMLLEYFMDEIFTDVIRVTPKDMDIVLQKYMGISVNETKKIGLDKMYYLEEYDAYYMMHGDTNYVQCVFESGKVNPDGSITLQYYRMDHVDALYWVTLEEEDGEYHIISNIMIASERR